MGVAIACNLAGKTARPQGNAIGRPVLITPDKDLAFCPLRRQRDSLPAIAQAIGVSIGTVKGYIWE